MSGHGCPLCGKPHVPLFRFCCPRCYDYMPSPMRREASIAWRFRISEPSRYADTLAGILQWNRDRTAKHQPDDFKMGE